MRLGLDLVIFDCDGVLVDSEILSMRAYESLLADIGLTAPDDIWAQCIGRKEADIFALIEREVGALVPPDLRAQLWPRTKALFQTELKATSGIVDFLEALETPRCVASSSDPERLRLSLSLTGLARFFGDDVFSTQYVSNGKPAPDIFYYAAAKMNARPASSVVIEDSAPGVIGARAAGAKVIGFLGGAHVKSDHGERLKSAGANAIAESWREVDELLAKPGWIGL